MQNRTKKVISVLLSVVLLFACAVPAFATEAKPFEDSLFYEQGDYSIHYRMFPAQGESEGYILFLHGFLYSGESFVPMAEKMSAAGYTCVVADCPGFGYSTRETADITPIAREDLMVGLMESIAPLDQWIVAGQSMGGGISLNIACAHPEIQALFLVAPAPINATSPMMEAMASSKLMSGMFNAILKIMLRMNLLVKLMMYMATMDMSYTKQYDIAVLTAPLAVEGTADSMLYMMTRATPTDVEALAKLEMPILLVRGDKDMVVSASSTADMDAALAAAGAKKIVIPGGGHMINETHCDYLCDELLAFLAA